MPIEIAMAIVLFALSMLSLIVYGVLSKRKSRWCGLTLVFVIAFIACALMCVIVAAFVGSSKPVTARQEESKAASPEDAAADFADRNGISLALAQSIEHALAECGYSLSQAYNFEQTDDWAYGQRYHVWIDMEYTWTIYTQDDEVKSIRARNGDFMYQAEG